MPKRGEVLPGSTRRIKTGCGNIYITTNRNDNGKIEEVFIRLGKAGGCASSQTEALGRLITLALKYGTPIEDIVKQLLGIGCQQPVFAGSSNKILSCADAVAKGLALQSRKEVKITEQPSEVRKEVTSNAVAPLEDKIKGISENLKKVEQTLAQGACPDCGSPVIFQEGCKKCLCGWTEC